jgi:hypothetical protein
MTPNQNELAFWLSGLWHSSPLFSIFNRWKGPLLRYRPLTNGRFANFSAGVLFRAISVAAISRQKTVVFIPFRTSQWRANRKAGSPMEAILDFLSQCPNDTVFNRSHGSCMPISPTLIVISAAHY